MYTQHRNKRENWPKSDPRENCYVDKFAFHCSRRCSVRPLHTMEYQEVPKCNGKQISQLIYSLHGTFFVKYEVRKAMIRDTVSSSRRE